VEFAALARPQGVLASLNGPWALVSLLAAVRSWAPSTPSLERLGSLVAQSASVGQGWSNGPGPFPPRCSGWITNNDRSRCSAPRCGLGPLQAAGLVLFVKLLRPRAHRNARVLSGGGCSFPVVLGAGAGNCYGSGWRERPAWPCTEHRLRDVGMAAVLPAVPGHRLTGTLPVLFSSPTTSRRSSCR